MKAVMTLVLAGGKGERLQPLTQHRAKPAVPFGAVYRIIDFTLTNCVQSGLRQILVLTQYKSQSLQLHLRHAWGGFNRQWGEFLEIVPPQQRRDDRWYEGTADAVFQNAHEIEGIRPEHVLILAADHVYRMDYRPLIRQHMDSGSDATVACIPVPLEEGSSFGVMHIDSRRMVQSFKEKPSNPEPMPDDHTKCLASMGIYVFRTDVLLAHLDTDARDPRSRHDFARNIIPRILQSGRVQAFPFENPRTGESGYWRDVGSLDAYYEASMDLLADDPAINLHDTSWTVCTQFPSAPPSRMTARAPIDSASSNRVLLGPGTIIEDAQVSGSILSPFVRIAPDAEVANSILFDRVRIGRGAAIRNAIIDKDVIVPDGEKIGFDSAWDQDRGLVITENGLTIVPKRYVFSTYSQPVVGRSYASDTPHTAS